MLPETITSTIPVPRTPTIDICRTRLEMFLASMKLPLVKIENVTHMAIRAPIITKERISILSDRVLKGLVVAAFAAPEADAASIVTSGLQLKLA